MKKYSEYKKKKAIKRYLDSEKVEQIAGAMKTSTSTIYSWIRQYNEKRNSIANEVTELRKLAERQQKMIEILKTVDCTVSAPLKEKLSQWKKCMGNTIITCYVRLWRWTEVHFLTISNAAKAKITGIISAVRN